VGPFALGCYVIWFSDEKLIDPITKYIMLGIYAVFLIIDLVFLFITSFSDPGILPSLFMNSGITSIEKKSADNVKDYYVEYQSKQQLSYTMDYLNITDPTKKFYSLNKFVYLRPTLNDDSELVIDKKKKHNKLSYCESCNMLRPPRSFHCAQCGVCIEAHDHHCPWVGTCIGYRNLKWFIAFLFWTGILATVTLALTGYCLFTCVD